MADLSPDAPSAGVFVSLDLEALTPPQRSALRQAGEDVRAVAAGRAPPHARLDADAPLPADGGTCYYLGHGYRLTVLRQLCGVGAQTAIAYGPILQLDETLFAGPVPAVSDVRMYAPAALQQLRRAAAET